MDSQIRNIVESLSDSLSYNGLDTVAVRKMYLDRGGTKEDLIKLLVAYISIGNNHQNLLEKTKKPDVGRSILNIIKKYGISERVTGKDASILTLPRLATAFAPILIKIRKEMIKRNLIKQQVDTITPLKYQDLSLNLIPESHDYVLKFSILISNKDRRGIKNDMSEDEIIKSAQYYNNLAVEGLKRDSILSEVLSKDDPDDESLMKLFEFSP